MTQPNVCRLCVKISQDGKSLYSDNGHGNELHEMVCKYFHPQIVNMDEAKHLTVVCSRCTHYISGFHMFETSIWVAQLNLAESGKSLKETGRPALDNTKARSVATEVNEEIEIDDSSTDQDPLDCDDSIESASKSSSVGVNSTGAQTRGSKVRSLAKKQGNEIEIVSVLHLKPIPPRENAEVEKAQVTKEKPLKINQSEEMGIDRSEHISDNDDGDSSDNEDLNIDDENALVYFSSAVSNVFNGNQKQYKKALHKATAKFIKTKKCAVCSKPYPSLATLQKHFLQKHPREKFYITCCSRRFYCGNKIAEHALLHMNPNIFKCNVCDKKYCFKSSLKTHVQQNHPEYTKLLCRLCWKVTKTQEERLQHYASKHETDPPPKATAQANGRTKYPCTECDESFRTILAYYHHFWLLHRLVGNKLFICPFCSLSYEKNEHLIRHIHLCHPQKSTEHFAMENDKSSPSSASNLMVAMWANRETQQIRWESYLNPVPKSATSKGSNTKGSAEDSLKTMQSKGMEINSETHLKTHGSKGSALQHHPTQEIYISSESDCSSSDDDYCECPDCGTHLESPREMIEHLACKHRNLELYSCPCCPIKFSMVTDIARHRKKKHPQAAKNEYYKHMDDNYNKLFEECRRTKRARSCHPPQPSTSASAKKGTDT